MSHNESILQLRRFAPHDMAALISWPQSLTEVQWWAGPQTPWPLTPVMIQRWHTDPDARPYVLHRGEALLGYGELWVDAEEQEVELARVIVAPTQRGKGFGVALVGQLLAEAGRTAYPRTFVRVVPENRVAIACYLRAGFTPVSPADQRAFNRGQLIEYLWMSYDAR
ncbi:MAG: GNAT family N-acetyltransferase [Blastochloris sp.]|nr:GNAT family N-acetyltransferase [Blastochloris sp.]